MERSARRGITGIALHRAAILKEHCTHYAVTSPKPQSPLSLSPSRGPCSAMSQRVTFASLLHTPSASHAPAPSYGCWGASPPAAPTQWKALTRRRSHSAARRTVRSAGRRARTPPHALWGCAASTAAAAPTARPAKGAQWDRSAPSRDSVQTLLRHREPLAARTTSAPPSSRATEACAAPHATRRDLARATWRAWTASARLRPRPETVGRQPPKPRSTMRASTCRSPSSGKHPRSCFSSTSPPR